MSNPLKLVDWQGDDHGSVGYSIGLRPDRLEIEFIDGRIIAVELEDTKVRVHLFGPEDDEPFSLDMLPPEKVMWIEVFPMDNEGGLADTFEEVDHYDVLYRADGEDPELEYEGLTLRRAEHTVKILKYKYPDASEDWSCVELLK